MARKRRDPRPSKAMRPHGAPAPAPAAISPQPAAGGASPSRRTRWWIAGAWLLALGLTAAGWWRWSSEPPAPPKVAASAPLQPAAQATYVANAQCVECHREPAERWRTSHHALAMAPP